MLNKNNTKQGERTMNNTQKKIDDIAFKVGVDRLQDLLNENGLFVDKNRVELLCNNIVNNTIKLNKMDKNEPKGILLNYILMKEDKNTLIKKGEQIMKNKQQKTKNKFYKKLKKIGFKKYQMMMVL
jgi:hypothetical protein